MARDAFFLDPRDDDPRAGHLSEAQKVQQFAPLPQNPFRYDIRESTVPVARGRRSRELEAPRAHYLGDRAYLLRDSELQTLAEIGRFRVIAAPDLAHFSYGGDTNRAERDIGHLRAQSLLS